MAGHLEMIRKVTGMDALTHSIYSIHSIEAHEHEGI